MRYNSYTTELTLLNSVVRWFLIYSPDSAAISLIQFQNVFITHKRNPLSTGTHSSFLFSLQLLAITNFFSGDFLILDIYINGVTQYVAFRICHLPLSTVFSRVIVVVAHSIFLSFLWLSIVWIDHICLSIRLWTFWVVFTLSCCDYE